MLFALITWQVAVDGPLRAADERLDAVLRHPHPPSLLAELCADLGNPTVALPVLAAAMGYAVAVGGYRRWLPPLCAALAMATVAVVVPLLKVWLDRPGPLGSHGYYPSGHAAASTIAYGGAALLISLYARRPPYWPLPATAALLVAANGAGLVWRGYHWPLDVLASWCLCWVLLAGATATARRGLRGGGREGAKATHDSGERGEPDGPDEPVESVDA